MGVYPEEIEDFALMACKLGFTFVADWNSLPTVLEYDCLTEMVNLLKYPQEHRERHSFMI